MKPNFLQAEKITKTLFILMIESESQQLAMLKTDLYFIFSVENFLKIQVSEYFK